MSDIWQAFTPVSSLWNNVVEIPIVDTWQMVEQPDTVATLIDPSWRSMNRAEGAGELREKFTFSVGIAALPR